MLHFQVNTGDALTQLRLHLVTGIGGFEVSTHALINLTYDNVGNLTDDGIFLYTLDGWNRVVKATRREDALTTVATYAFDGLGRLAARVFSHCGVEQVANDGGDTTVHNYYDARKPLETRNGSNQVTFQMVWGTQNQRELVLYEKNGDPTAANDTDPDVTATGEGSESPADQRWFVANDRSGRVTAKTEYDTGGTNNGRVTERYDRNLLASSGSIIQGDSGNGEAGVVDDFPDNGGPQPALPWFPDPPQVFTLPYGGGGQPGNPTSPIPDGSKPYCAYRWSQKKFSGSQGGDVTAHLGIDIVSSDWGLNGFPNYSGSNCNSTPPGMPAGIKSFWVDYGTPPNNDPGGTAPYANALGCRGFNYSNDSMTTCDIWNLDQSLTGNCLCRCLALAIPPFYYVPGRNTCQYNSAPPSPFNNSNAGVANAVLYFCRMYCLIEHAPQAAMPSDTNWMNARGWDDATNVQPSFEPCTGYATCN